jgi:translocation and assembly module TamB
MTRWLRRAGIASGVAACGLAAALVLLQSDWAKEKARARLVEEVDRATGGRASLRALDFDLLRLRARAQGFILRGKEHDGQAPFFQAESIEAGAQVLSWWGRRIRLRDLTVVRPQLRIYVYEDGATNLPDTGRKREKGNFVEDLIRLQIARMAAREGYFEFAGRGRTFELQAEGLDAGLRYEGRGAGLYRAQLSAREVRLPGGLKPQVEVEALLEGNRLQLENGTARLGESRLQFSGLLEDWKQPRLRVHYRGAVMLRDIPQSPVQEGFGSAEGEAAYDLEGGWRVLGALRAEQLGYKSKAFAFRRVSAAARFELTPDRLDLRELTLAGPYGRWRGAASLESWRRFRMQGEAQEIRLDHLQAVFLDRPYAWSGNITGPVSFSGELTSGGLRAGRAAAALRVAPAAGELPLTGELNLNWSQECACIDFGSSSLATDSARLNFQGVLGRRMEAGLFATRIRDLEPVIAMLLHRESYQLPISLAHGTAQAQAVVTGSLQAPEIRGRASISNAVVEDIHFDSAGAEFFLAPGRLQLTAIQVQQEAARISGNLSLGLDGWTAGTASRLQASLQMHQGDVSRLLRLMRIQAQAAGTLEASAELSGTAGAPWGQARFRLAGGSIGAEKLQAAQGEISITQSGEWKATLEEGRSRASMDGAWLHPAGDFRSGRVRLSGTLTGLRTTDWETLVPQSPVVEAEVAGEYAAVLSFSETGVSLQSISGALSAPSLRIGARRLGALRLSGRTQDGVMSLQASVALPQGPAEAAGTVELQGDYLSEGSVKLPRISFGMLHEMLGEDTESWPVRGFFEGGLTWRGPLRDLKKLTAQATVRDLQVRPRQQELLETQVDSSGLTLRNNGPLVFDLTQPAIRVRSARFTALETDLEMTGAYSPGARSPWNVDVTGTANLAVLGSFYKDLLASGSAQVAASLRGPAADPQLSGRMDIRNASFFLKDIANGVEKAEGAIFFDKNRANIQKLTGVTGGGSFQLTGFAGLNRGELSYRLQMTTRGVRVRYPEGVSTTLDSDLALTGSSARSLLAGSITIKRSGFVMAGDLASLVGNTGNPLPAAAVQNEFLRNLQFDVRVRTSPDAMFLSNYTSDLQMEADLRLRGSPAKPVLLGNIKANQGQVNFFGNRYTISRGEVLFFNTAVVQPQIDLDLETRVRGITVYLNVNGPLSRLNVTYRSEPPLQSSEILALLTVGRAPASTTTSIATSDSIRSQTVMENSTASNTLLGTALSAGLNSRTERFFGASRIRIDPAATGVDNLPQARLSIEQSISRDITLTYITNLNRSQQQVVQLEWDLNRQWSMIAIKDENGTFAVDFLFRRRFN